MNSSTLGIAEQIKQLKELLDIGAITQEDYEKKKNELLNGAFGGTNKTPVVYEEDAVNVNLDELVLGEADYKFQFYKNLDQDLLKKKAIQAITGKSVGFLDIYFTQKGLVLSSPDWGDVSIEKTLITYDKLKCSVIKTKIMVLYKTCFITIIVDDTPISFFFYEDAYLDLSIKLGQKIVRTEATSYMLSKTKGNEFLEKLVSYGVNIE